MTHEPANGTWWFAFHERTKLLASQIYPKFATARAFSVCLCSVEANATAGAGSYAFACGKLSSHAKLKTVAEVFVHSTCQMPRCNNYGQQKSRQRTLITYPLLFRVQP